jgi:uncharacterized membrane protein
MSIRLTLNKTKKVTMISLMAAAAIATNYLLIGVFNVKLMDIIVFATGYLLGSASGATVGFLVWMVYGTLNPYGFNLPILLATALSETIYGISGGLFSIKMGLIENMKPDLRLAVIGFLLTLIYDLMTNVVSVVTVGVPLTMGLIAGIPFGLMHEVSNSIFFAFGLPPLVRSINQFMKVKR